MKRLALLLALTAGLATGQTFTINTIAGPGSLVGQSASILGLYLRTVATDASGNIYFGDDSGNAGGSAGSGRVFEVNPSGIIIQQIGGGAASSLGDGGPASQASLSDPVAVVVDTSGNIYITDRYRIRKVAVGSGIITTVAGTGNFGYAGDGGLAINAGFAQLNGLAVDSAGNLYIADYTRIRKITAATGLITTIAGTNTLGDTNDGGQATSAEVEPLGLAVDASGNVYMADYVAGSVRKILASNGVITTIMTGLNNPHGLAVDSSGNLYVADNGNSRIRKYSNGTATTLYTDPINTGVLYGVAVDPSGNVYLSDEFYVRKISSGGSLLNNIAGNGVVYDSSTGDGGAATAATIAKPQGLAADGAGNLYIGDTGHRELRYVDSSGLIHAFGSANLAGYTFSNLAFDSAGNLFFTNGSEVNKVAAGTSTATSFASQYFGMGANPGACDPNGFPGDGCCLPGSTGYFQFGNIAALAVDTNGNLYVADPENNQVVKVPASGGAGSVYFGGFGTNNAPEALAFDGSGNLYIANWIADTIVKITPGGQQSIVRSGITASTLAFDGSGNLLVLADGVLSRYSGGVWANIAGTGTAGYSGDGGPALNAQIPDGAMTTIGSNIYLADTSYGVIRELSVSTQTAATVALTSSSNPAIFNQVIQLTATVTPSGATGTITFKDGSTILGSPVTLIGGAASLNPVSLSIGTHSITAVYSGDTHDTSATSSVLTQTITNGTITDLTAVPNPSAYGQTVTFTATVSSVATGTVVFKDGLITMGSATLNSQQAFFNISSLTPGSHSITAVYLGDSTYSGSTSAPVIQIVNQASGAVTLTSSLNPSVYLQTLTITASVSPSSATGTVTFKDGSTTVGGPISLTGGTASISLSTLLGGTHSLTAVYSGDSNYAGGTSTTLVQTVNQTSTSTTFTASPNPSRYGQTLLLTATVTPAVSEGLVMFYNGGTVIGSVTPVSGAASMTIATLAPGTYSLSAVFGSSGNYGVSGSGAVTQVVNQAFTPLSLSLTPNPSTYGATVTLTAAVPQGATGNITFMDGSTVLGVPVAISNGIASLAISTFAVGAHSLTAVYGGDTNDAANISAVTAQSVTPAVLIPAITVSDKVYDGGGVATPTSQTLSGIVGTDNVTLNTGTPAFVAKNVGTGIAVVATALSLGGTAAGNYQLSGPSTVSTFAGNGMPSFPGSDGGSGNATSVALWSPGSLTVDSSGNLYVVEVLAGRIRKVTASTGQITTIVPSAEGTDLGIGLVVDAAGNLYYSDNISLVYKIPAGQSNAIVFAGGGSSAQDSNGDGGPATSALLGNPAGLAVDSNGNVYIADLNSGLIRKVSAATGIITSVGRVYGPTGVAVDSSGNVYVSCSDTTVRKIAAGTGIVTAYAGNGNGGYVADGTAGFSGDGGLATNALVSYPSQLAVDSAGNLFIADQGNSRIRMVSAATGIITTVAGTGTGDFNGDGASPLSTDFNMPFGIAVDPLGNVYIADSNNNRVRQYMRPSVATTANITPRTLTVTAQPNTKTYDGTTSASAIPTVAGIQGFDTVSGLSETYDTPNIGTGKTLSVGAFTINDGNNGNNYSVTTVPNSSGVVNAPATITTMSATPNPSVYGQLVTLVASVSGSGATGTVTYQDGATALATVPLVSGAASLSLPTLSAGTHSLTAVYSGDATHGGSTSNIVTQTVHPAASASSLLSSLNPSLYGQSVVLTASVTSGATGTVTFKDGSVTIGSGVLSAGSTSVTIATLIPGLHTLTAVYSGDANYTSATSAPLSQQVNPLSVAVTLTTSPPGLSVSLDGGAPQVSPYTTTLNSGSHTITTTAIQPGTTGTQYVLTGWSDSGAASHSITVGSSPLSYTATFQTQYQLLTGASPATGGTLTPATANFYNAGSAVSLTATANSGYAFSTFSGGLTGSTNPQTVTMNRPMTVAANFTALTPALSASSGGMTIQSTASVQALLNLTNTGLGNATNATVASISAISVVSGTGTVSVASGVPIDIGTINAGSQGSATVNFNWPSTATRIKFTVNFTADGGYVGASTLTVIR